MKITHGGIDGANGKEGMEEDGKMKRSGLREGAGSGRIARE